MVQGVEFLHRRDDMTGLGFCLHNDKRKPYLVRLEIRGKLSHFLLIERALMFTLVLI